MATLTYVYSDSTAVLGPLAPLVSDFKRLPKPDHVVGSSKAIRSLAKLVGYPVPGWSGSERMLLPL